MRLPWRSETPDDDAAATSVGRHAQFAAFARRVAAGEVIVPPQLLPREQRRLHVRATLREDHVERIQSRPDQAQAKFDKLARSPFHFFRGTALLFYRDRAGRDADLPHVFTIGDVHPENFGVRPNEDGAPVFGIDDFDEAHIAPFSWDLQRGALGFWIAARDAGMPKSRRKKLVRCFADGYFEGLRLFARDERERGHELRQDNSPPLIVALLERALDRRREFLRSLVDIERGRFVPSKDVVPHSAHIAEFQDAIDRYRSGLRRTTDHRAGHFKVKDVAIKKNSGTASLGLDRYYVLIDGTSGKPDDDIILELKQARRSALAGLVPAAVAGDNADADRIQSAQHVALAGGDAYHGCTDLDGVPFIVSEESALEIGLELPALSKSEAREYARICGFTLAHAHARSDEHPEVESNDVEREILRTVHPAVFTDDLVRGAEEDARRLLDDYALFLADHALGAYEFVDRPATVPAPA